jgi:hypothetical protein
MQREKLIQRILWDINLSVAEVEDLLQYKKENIRGVTIDQIYVRFLCSFNWYTLLKSFSQEQLKIMLSDRLLNKLKSTSLKEKYKYARGFL